MKMTTRHHYSFVSFDIFFCYFIFALIACRKKDEEREREKDDTDNDDRSKEDKDETVMIKMINPFTESRRIKGKRRKKVVQE